MKKLISVCFLFLVVICFVFSVSAEDFDKLLKLVMKVDSYSDVVILDSDITGKSGGFSGRDLKLVIVGPNCHKLPGWFFYGGSINTLIVLSDALDSTGTLNIFSCEIVNNFTNVPFYFAEDAIKKVLGIK